MIKKAITEETATFTNVKITFQARFDHDQKDISKNQGVTFVVQYIAEHLNFILTKIIWNSDLSSKQPINLLII